MNDQQVRRDLRAVIARLTLVSTAPIAGYNPSGGGDSEHPGGKRPPGSPDTPAARFTGRVHGADTGLRRRLDAAEAQGDYDQREREITLAHTWHLDALKRILQDARDELEHLTGRNDTAPQRRDAELDKPGELDALVLARGEGHPAGDVAVRFGLSEHHVRRIRRRDDRDTDTGQPLDRERVRAGEERRRRAREMAEGGMSQRQIAFTLGCDPRQVRRDLGKAA